MDSTHQPGDLLAAIVVDVDHGARLFPPSRQLDAPGFLCGLGILPPGSALDPRRLVPAARLAWSGARIRAASLVRDGSPVRTSGWLRRSLPGSTAFEMRGPRLA